MTRFGRAAAVGALVALVAAGCTRTTAESPGASPGTTAAPVRPTSSPTGTPTGPAARAVLTDPDLAGTRDPATLRAMARRELTVDGGWGDRVASDIASWPVYVGTATVDADGRVQLDVAVSVPPQDDDRLVLRWLPAARALGDAVQRLQVEVDGDAVAATVDRDGARILVPVPAGRGTTVRVRAAYTVPSRQALDDDGSPAGFGLLARAPGTLALGHWLPLVTLPTDEGPMVAWGDVGAFPAGAFSLQVSHEDGTLVSGGVEAACPGMHACTWLRGLGLRDVSAVLLTDAARAPAASEGAAVVAHAADTSGLAGQLGRVVREGADGLQALADHLGPLPWSTVDVVAVPIAPGALGMEFPGMAWIDPSAWPQGGPGLGSYVLAHELGHQWFHALVGNGSLSAPVVDESLAQYASVLVFDELFGPGAGDELAASSLGGRYRQARAEGVPDDVPAQPLDAFTTARSYGAAVYGRAGQAWVDAAEVAGRDVVVAALRELVAQHGLREVAEDDLLAALSAASPEAARILRDGWGR